MKPQQFLQRTQTLSRLSQKQKLASSSLSTTAPTTWVKVQGIGLYALWHKEQIPSASIPPDANIWARHTQIDLWPVTQLQWFTASSSSVLEEGAWIPADRMEEIFQKLHEYLSVIIRQGSGAAQNAGAQPAYLIYHIEAMQTQLPPIVRKNIQRSQRSQHRGKDAELTAQLGAQEEVLDALQLHLNIGNVDQHTGWGPSRFSHYDREKGHRGWIVFSPRLTIVAKLGTQQVNNLIALLQPRDTDASGTGEGILSQHYETVYERIMQWNAAHDIFETVVQLEKIVESGKKSTDGQLWLNFALAAIGVMLALFTGPVLHWRETLALLLLSGASVMYALYARNGIAIYQRIGWLFFATSIIVALTLLFWSH